MRVSTFYTASNRGHQGGTVVRKTGILILAIVVLVGLLGILLYRPEKIGLDDAAESVARAQLRTINTEEVTYSSSTGGKYGTIQDLISAGLLDRRYLGEIDGYWYEVQVQEEGKNYLATATPGGNAGRYSYRSTSDAVIRYGTGPTGTPIGQPVS
jgi:hypothetical protein